MIDRQTPARWLAKADEARAKADRMPDPISKRMTFEIADNYEALAKHEKSLAAARGLLGADRRKPL
jgi:hypothetical protein